ncbi:MAG TPA: hypothetical protein VGC13_09460 [Longimicrobium sp.]|jgi:hypothetical protein|uniref:hypothetical protein n=1 Tax=Longimicrobium sp. TaxID=2029185 RepID=UPI002EDAE1F4
MNNPIASYQAQSGSYPVGSSSNNFVTINIPFDPPLQLIPFVTANAVLDPAWPNIPDTFAVSVFNVSKTGFSVNIYRVDNLINVIKGGDPEGWAQNLQLGWIAYAD